jgi:Uma2 family endonuclease
MPLYARYGVPHLWLVDPAARTLETYALAEGAWKAIAVHRAEEAMVLAEPFTQVGIDLAGLWAS